MNNKIKGIAISGIGIALFVVMSLCLQVPVFENYYLCLGYIVMAVYCYSIGVGSGTLIGTIGVVLYCFIINGLRGMPGWALGNIAIGLIMGYAFKFGKRFKNVLKIFVFIIGIIVGTVIGIFIIKSGVEHILYAQPFVVRVASNIPAFIADLIVLIVGLPICKILDPYIKKLVNKN